MLYYMLRRRPDVQHRHADPAARPLPEPRCPAARRRRDVDLRALPVVGLTEPPQLGAHRLRALGARPDRRVRHDRGRAAVLRLLGLPAALLRGDVRRSRRAGARTIGRRTALRGGRDPAPGPGTRARPRGLRAAQGDVPGGRRPRAPAVDADPRPAPALRLGWAAGPTPRRGRAHRGVRVHDAQPALVQPRRALRRAAADALGRVRPLGSRGGRRGGRRRGPRLPRQGPRGPRGPPAHGALGAALRVPRRGLRLRRCRRGQRHRRLLVRPEQALLAVRLTPEGSGLPTPGHPRRWVSRKTSMRPQASSAEAGSGPACRTTQLTGATYQGWLSSSLRKECPASGYSRTSCSTPLARKAFSSLSAAPER